MVSNRDNRVRRINVPSARSTVARPRRPNRRRRPRAVPAKPWSNVVDDRIQDDKVRRDVLIALAMVLVAVVVIACSVCGMLGPMIREAAGNGIARVVAGSVFGGGLAYGGLRLHRRRGHRPGPTTGADPQSGACNERPVDERQVG